MDELRERVLSVLRTVHDPELPVNIVDLGLVYGIDTDDGAIVTIRMTLTSPGCPVAMELPAAIETRLLLVPGVSRARVQLVWDPPWCRDRMSTAARLELGL